MSKLWTVRLPAFIQAHICRCDGSTDRADRKRTHPKPGDLGTVGAAASEHTSPRIASPDHELVERAAVLRRCFLTEEGWTPAISYAGITCFYQRAPKGQGIIRVRAEAEVDAPLFDLASLFYEVGLWHRWAPTFGSLGLKRARVLGSQGPLRLVCQLEAKLPWPFRHRSCIFAAEAVDCLVPGDPHQQIVISMDSRRVAAVCPDLPAVEADGVVADLMDCGLILTPGEVAGTRGTLVQGVLNVDPHMYVPDWLLAISSMNLCILVILQWRRAAHLARTPEYLDISCDPQNAFYMHVRRRMAESFPAELALAPPQHVASEKG